MEPTLFADRFVPLDGHAAGTQLDLATGWTVLLRRLRGSEWLPPRAPWADRCAALFELSVPGLAPLVDFGECHDGGFEAFAVAPPVSRWTSRDRRTARLVLAVSRALHARGLSVGRLGPACLVAGRTGPMFLPGADVGLLLTSPALTRNGCEKNVVADECHRVRAFLATCGLNGGYAVRSAPEAVSGLASDRFADLQQALLDVLDAGTSGRPRRVALLVSRSSSRELLVARLARDIRLRGYVPVSAAVIDGTWSRAAEGLRQALERRHVCILDWDTGGAHSDGAGVFFSALTVASTRPHVLVQLLPAGTSSTRARPPVVSPGHVGEAPAVYRVRRDRAPDAEQARSQALVTAAVGAAARGRHAAAERMLRHAIGVFTRRLDAAAAGAALLMLGRVHLWRGRVEGAASCFTQARQLLEKDRRDGDALDAAILLGLAWTDAGRFEQAEAALRGAAIAACGEGLMPAYRLAQLGLARCLLWQSRPQECLDALAGIERGLSYDRLESQSTSTAAAGRVRECCLEFSPSPDDGGGRGAAAPLVTPFAPDTVVLCDCLSARASLELQAPQVALPRALAARARALARGDAEALAASCTAVARVQAFLGDLSAVRHTVSEGLAAARQAHAPLRGLRLRLVLLEAVTAGGGRAEAARMLGRLRRLDVARLPAVLRIPVERLFNPPPLDSRVPALPRVAVDAVVEVLDICQAAEDETEQVRAALRAIRRRVGAVTVCCHAVQEGALTRLVEEGLARGHDDTATHVLETGHMVPPESSGSGLEAAVPIKTAGAVVGVLSCRWPADTPANWPAVSGLLTAAAAALAPPVRILVYRHPAASRQASDPAPELIGGSEIMSRLRQDCVRVATAPFGVLIEGESGSGKELVARALHRLGPRCHRRFCALNCAALSDELVETELFGHARGAFTGAVAERMGLFEEADGGTLLLDEVGELSARAQAKLLRAIQEGEIRRVGENRPRRVDVRIVAATNQPLDPAVASGAFRRDLLYRLAVIRIEVPPLRLRLEDVPQLAAHFWRQATERVGSRAVLAPATIAALARYDWPGNVRELQNVLAGLAVAVAKRGIVRPDRLPAAIAGQPTRGGVATLDEARRGFETRYVKAALARAGGHRGRAAEDLGMTRQGLAKLLARLSLDGGTEPVQWADAGASPNTDAAHCSEST